MYNVYLTSPVGYVVSASLIFPRSDAAGVVDDALCVFVRWWRGRGNWRLMKTTSCEERRRRWIAGATVAQVKCAVSGRRSAAAAARSSGEAWSTVIVLLSPSPPCMTLGRSSRMDRQMKAESFSSKPQLVESWFKPRLARYIDLKMNQNRPKTVNRDIGPYRMFKCIF